MLTLFLNLNNFFLGGGTKNVTITNALIYMLIKDNLPIWFHVYTPILSIRTITQSGSPQYSGKSHVYTTNYKNTNT